MSCEVGVTVAPLGQFFASPTQLWEKHQNRVQLEVGVQTLIHWNIFLVESVTRVDERL